MEQLTIKDIARLCGTSVSTVSRALNGHPDVSEAVRSQVKSVAREHHYIPNNSARNLVKKESDAIALVVRGISNPFFTQLIRTIEPDIYSAGYSFFMHQIASDADELTAAAVLEREKKLQGILFLGGRFNYTSEETEMIRVPFVCCTYSNAFGTLPAGSYSSVTIDDKAEACMAVEELYLKGHRRIAALIAEELDNSISQLRYEGYRAALSAHGIPFDRSLVECADNFSMPAAYEATRRLMARRCDFTAVFTIADAMALAAIKALDDGGRRVPKDCSVIGIDGLELSNYSIPTLTTLEQPAEELGRESVRMLIELIEGRGKNKHVVMRTRLREGSSVRQITI